MCDQESDFLGGCSLMLGVLAVSAVCFVVGLLAGMLVGGLYL